MSYATPDRADIAEYLKKVLGGSITLRPLAEGRLAALPPALRRPFELCTVTLAGHRLTLALVTAEARPPLSQLAAHREALAEALGGPVALALFVLSSPERRWLIDHEVPFLVPGRQLFLPMLLMDLRDNRAHARIVPPRVPAVNWVAQLVLLRHLVAGDVEPEPLEYVAAMLGYSPVAVTKAVHDLTATGLCTCEKEGRQKRIHFELEGRALWEAAQPHFRSPVKRRLWLEHFAVPPARRQHAGLSALAEAVPQDAGSPPVYAVDTAEARLLFATGKLREAPLEDAAIAVLEVWAYRPDHLYGGAQVDPFSLYLSLRDDPNERVQAALAARVSQALSRRAR